MHIAKDGLVMNNAYAFWEMKDRPVGNLNGCGLQWRFVWFGSLKVFLNLFFVFVFLPLMAVLWMVWAPYTALIGRRVYYVGPPPHRKESTATVIWGPFERMLPDRFFVLYYRSTPNWGLPQLIGFRVLPGVVLLVLAYLSINVLFIMHVHNALQSGTL